MARNSLLVLNADVPLRNYTLTHSTRYVSEIGPGEFIYHTHILFFDRYVRTQTYSILVYTYILQPCALCSENLFQVHDKHSEIRHHGSDRTLTLPQSTALVMTVGGQTPPRTTPPQVITLFSLP